MATVKSSSGSSGTVEEGEDEESSSSSSLSPGVAGLSLEEPSLPQSLFDDVIVDALPSNHKRSIVSSVVTERELTSFRQQWKAEVTKRFNDQLIDQQSRNTSGTLSPSPEPSNLHKPGSGSGQFDAPEMLYKQGMAFEQKGLMHEAVRCYRQAIHLVPDIEQQFYQKTLVAQQQKLAHVSDCAEQNSDLERNGADDFSNSTEDEDCTMDDLVTWFESRLHLPTGRKMYCLPADKAMDQCCDNVCHVSELPVEVLINIFKWVISSDLDLRQLEQLSLVCRGFYVLAREAELWKLSCVRLWGSDCSAAVINDGSLYSSWRQMYLNRPHPYFNGLYIARISYIRHGEATFQDSNYRPWHMVVYYRYVKFFSDGNIIMVTTPDEPQVVIPTLRTKWPQHTAALKGSFQFIEDDCIGAVLRRPKRNWNENVIPYYVRRRTLVDNNSNENDQIYSLEFRVSDTKKRKNNCLQWLGYQISIRYKNGQENRSHFVLTDQNFPPMYFSRVKSYASYSDRSL